jgi:hypothetical protein
MLLTSTAPNSHSPTRPHPTIPAPLYHCVCCQLLPSLLLQVESELLFSRSAAAAAAAEVGAVRRCASDRT